MGEASEYKPPVYERTIVRFTPSPMMAQYHEGLQRKYEESRREWRKLHPDRDYKSTSTREEDRHAEAEEKVKDENKDERKNCEEEIRQAEKAHREESERQISEIKSKVQGGDEEDEEG